ncbi:hypothetical protein PsorP6_010117 [Peronosclerospora sorghi]|uniref:Uncharacterized protein n=1 Tax=Peronosclerospora sorghi TaxID=230839 RepID=A0ACC0VUV9_9STRA|nr:hypothetical protein PsorP6_010117 [Peronosclerospora sorghi]
MPLPADDKAATKMTYVSGRYQIDPPSATSATEAGHKKVNTFKSGTMKVTIVYLKEENISTNEA